VVGADKVDTDMAPVMGGEDFAFMLEGRPGAFIFTGNGEGSANLHSPHYDFNDDIIPLGTSYWVELVETRLGGVATDRRRHPGRGTRPGISCDGELTIPDSPDGLPG
jgi:hypothetical protein